MKKLFNAVFLFFLIVTSANAQLFVGGGFSFSTSGGSIESNGNSVDKVKRTNFTFTPKVGYFLSENFAVGAQLIVSTQKETTPGAIEVAEKSSGFGIAPFARYYALRLDKFSLFGEAELGLVFSSSKTEAAGITDDGPKSTSIGFNITPGVAFALSEKVELEAKVNVFNFGYNYNSQKEEAGNDETINKTSNFGFGVGLDNVVNTGDISIGVIIKL